MYRGLDLVELVKHLTEQRVKGLAIALSGSITSTDPSTYRAKVELDLTGTETGWLPIGALLAGPGYGILALPTDGTHVMVLFEGGDGQGSDQYGAGKILPADFNAVDTVPAQIKPGEILLQSVGGAAIKLDASGIISLNGGSEPVARVGDTIEVVIGGITYTGTITTGSSNVKA